MGNGVRRTLLWLMNRDLIVGGRVEEEYGTNMSQLAPTLLGIEKVNAAEQLSLARYQNYCIH